LYSVVQAESHEAAAKSFEGHPHLQIPQSSSTANAKAIPPSEEFFKKPLSNVIFKLHEFARS
jgi:hypothetical protein